MKNRTHYSAGEHHNARNDFKYIFKMDIQDFYGEFEHIIYIYTEIFTIDPIKFEKRLQEIHPDYIEGVSMQEIVLKHYGEEGMELLLKLTNYTGSD